MRLEQIIARLSAPRVRGAVKLAVDGITCHSREAGPGKLFVLLPEFQRQNPYQAFSAVERGAAAVICAPGASLPPGATRIEVDDSREAYARIAAAFLGQPGDKLQLIKVMGSRAHGVAGLLHQLLNLGGLRTSLLGSAGCIVDGKPLPKAVGTLDALEVQDAFARMVRSGGRACVVELTPDSTRARTFAGLSFNQSVDTDECSGTDSSLTGLGVGAVRARQLDLDFRRTRFVVRLGNDQVVIRSRVIGRRNAKDLLTSIVAASEAGSRASNLARAATRLVPMPGALEAVSCGQPFGVFVDGAREGVALAEALKDAREITPGRVIAVLGGPANLDSAARQALGQAAGGLADRVVVTSNDPGFADPVSLAKDVVHGVPMARDGSIRLELNRARAISLALNMARMDDVVVITGKGQRRTDFIEGAVIPFDDAEEARLSLAERGYVSDEF
jgi:UDP-N-acetylmuramoyl-L-alanyl-D-glutamate--2,6-diaminopimelate ligase